MAEPIPCCFLASFLLLDLSGQTNPRLSIPGAPSPALVGNCAVVIPERHQKALRSLRKLWTARKNQGCCPRTRRDVFPKNGNLRSSLLCSSLSSRWIHAQQNQPAGGCEPRPAPLCPGPSVQAFIRDWKISLQKVFWGGFLSLFLKVFGAQLCFTPRQTLQALWELTAHQHQPQPPQALWQGPGSQRQYSHLGFLRSETALLLLIIKYSSVEPPASPPVTPGGHSKAQMLYYPFKPASGPDYL